MRKLCSLLFTFGLLAFTAIAEAGSMDTQWVARDWETPYTQMNTRLWLTSTEKDSLNVYVSVVLTDEAALRIGETEEWRVRGRVYSSSGQNHQVEVVLEPSRYYHAYPAYLSRTVSVWGSGSQYVYFYVGNGGRIQDGAAPSIDKAKVDYTDLESPFTLRFRDFGFEENGSAPTSYQFTVSRLPSLVGSEKLVAKGELARVDAELQEVVVEKGGAFTQGAEEWFKEGKRYAVRVRVKRTGTPWYTDAYGDPFFGTFEWNSHSRTLVPVQSHGLVEGPREASFERLHGGLTE
jgi:hypothetical protein